MANIFFLPFRPAYDGNLKSIPGAQIWFTLPGTNTASAPYADEDLTIPHTNPVVANGFGRFPTIWLDEAINYRVRIYEADAVVGVDDPVEEYDPYSADIITGTEASDAVVYSESVTDLAARADYIDGKMALVVDSPFRFVEDDLSAEVTLDGLQAIYVAPDAIPDGSEGAWVREFGEGFVNAKWFGATGDGVTNDGPAIQAAIDFLKATASNVSTNTFYKGGLRLRLPGGNHFYCADTTLDIAHTLIIEGDTGFTNTKLSWDDGVTGIRVQRYNTSGAGTVDGVTHTGGDHTIIRGMYLFGGYVATEGAFHGIHVKGRVIVENCLIENWPGDGIFSNVTAGSGGANEGNANCSIVRDCIIQGCRSGVATDGADSNVWAFDNVQANSNRFRGFNDSSFLGNTYVNCHTSANGWSGAAGSIATATTLSGNRYMPIPGQETGASTNSPSGTTAHNTWWLYIGAGGVFTGVPAWVSGTTFRSGTSYFSIDANCRNTYIGCYSESDQNPAFINAPSVIIGGQHGFRPFGHAPYILPDTAGNMEFGFLTGALANYEHSLFNTNAGGGTTTVKFQSITSAGTRTVNATLTSINGGALRIDSVFGTTLRFNGSDIASVTTNGINLASGKVYQINGTDIRNPSVQSVTSSATVTPTFSDDLVKITAQAAALNLANPTGTAVPGWGMAIRIKDNGTARAITYGTQYRAIGVTLPTTTVISKTLYLGLIFNSDDTKWDIIAVAQEA